MKTVWKWILGVLLVVLVIGGLAAAAFFARSHMLGISYRAMPLQRSWENGPMMRGDGFDRRVGPMGPMMRLERGFRPFGGIFGFGGGLLRLVVFGLLLYGAYWLGRRNARVVVDPRTPASPPPAPQAPPQEPPAASE